LWNRRRRSEGVRNLTTQFGKRANEEKPEGSGIKANLKNCMRDLGGREDKRKCGKRDDG
jgi:hypothetical protein